MQHGASVVVYSTVRFTKSGSVLPLYKISVLLKTGDAGVFIITRKINVVIKQHSNDSINSVVVKEEDCCRGRRFESQYGAIFLDFFFHFLFI